MNKFGASVWLTAALITLSAVAGAVVPWDTPVPRIIPYRGILENDGTPVDGPVDFTFELFNVDTLGSALWSETQIDVNVQSGQFAVRLGENGGNPLPDAVFQTDTLYLEVTVDDGGGAVLLNGRQRLNAVPFAVRSERTLVADTAFVADHGVPAGTIVGFGGTTPPAGWLMCNGALLTTATYPELYAAIGDANGYETLGTDFYLPDARGSVSTRGRWWRR